jgi:hypothetical protein
VRSLQPSSEPHSLNHSRGMRTPPHHYDPGRRVELQTLPLFLEDDRYSPVTSITWFSTTFSRKSHRPNHGPTTSAENPTYRQRDQQHSAGNPTYRQRDQQHSAGNPTDPRPGPTTFGRKSHRPPTRANNIRPEIPPTPDRGADRGLGPADPVRSFGPWPPFYRVFGLTARCPRRCSLLRAKGPNVLQRRTYEFRCAPETSPVAPPRGLRRQFHSRVSHNGTSGMQVGDAGACYWDTRPRVRTRDLAVFGELV